MFMSFDERLQDFYSRLRDMVVVCVMTEVNQPVNLSFFTIPTEAALDQWQICTLTHSGALWIYLYVRSLG